MRILVISDIHANLEAFEAVVSHADEQWDECWFLGDLAGYGPDLVACFELLESLKPQLWLAGNHDLALLEDLPLWSTNAQHALHYQRQGCSVAQLRHFSAQLNLSCKEKIAGGLAVHASPVEPVWQYLISEADHLHAAEQLQAETRFLCYGHTHCQKSFSYTLEKKLKRLAAQSKAAHEEMLIFNPGSVGQPRDNDPRACYALFDPKNLHLQLERVSYSFERTGEKMRKQHLPAFLYERLALGR